MNPSLVEPKIRCPYCDEAMRILLDLSAGDQSYVEDCQVCCQPMLLSYQCDEHALTDLQVERAS